jgi:triacylglycerol esterase/lipase EstA (alpha/beta hydrolase family)
MRRLRLVPIVLLVLAATVLGAARAGAAQKKRPVPYEFITSAVVAGLHPDASPPGANDWHCRPSAAHPEPVVLVHGLTGNKNTNWQTYAPLLKNNGYCVYALTYGQSPYAPAPFTNSFGGFTRMERSARQLKAFVARVLHQTGAAKVDILGHSEGTQMPDYYAKFLGGARYIDKYVSLAPLWHGTNLAGQATLYRFAAAMGFKGTVDQLFGPFFAAGPELLTGSDFYKKLRSHGGPAVPGIRYTNIVTKYDELVSPYTSGIQRGMRNYVVQNFCGRDYSEHFQIAADPVAARIVLNTLDPAHMRPVTCRLVLPFEGGVPN